MRTRLFSVLFALLACVLGALSVPFAWRVAADHQQAMFVDRLQATSRFASKAQQATNSIDDQALQEDLVRYHEVFGIDAAIVDRTGASRQTSGSVDLDDPAAARALALARAGHQSQNPPLIWPGDNAVLVVAVPVIRGDDVVGAAVTVSSTKALRGTIATDLVLLFGADVAALTVFIVFAQLAAAWILRPVYSLDAAARQITTGDLATRVRVEGGPVEVRRLATSFNRMAEAMETSMRRQQRFFADASHQLRNPLAALALWIEGLADGVSDDKAGELDLVLEETSRLATILDDLLHLASVQEATTANRRPTDVVQLVAARVLSWRPLTNERNLQLSFHHPAAAMANIDSTLTSSVIDAILDNARKFSPFGGLIEVRVVAESRQVRVEVVDQGPGVSVAELERIGDRFWRSPASQNTAGSGLGLSIARELAALSGGELTFSLVDPTGLRVTLLLHDTCTAEKIAPPEVPTHRRTPRWPVARRP